MKKHYFIISSFIYLLFVTNILKAQTPTVTSFSPSSGAVGTLVTIVGTNLQHPTAFTIGGINAIVVSDTSVVPSNYGDTLVGLVMPGATTGIISVTTANGTITSTGNFKVTSTTCPNQQQGNKLTGKEVNENDAAYQGVSVSISADGNTAIVGGDHEGNDTGAAWIYTRSAGIWTQQGNKLVGKGSVGTYVYQGAAVSISADGNTAVVGGYGDSNNTGAVWIFVRNNGRWIQQGNKLVVTGASGPAYIGGSVSVSADGNTIITGGPGDNSREGAAWVFTRSAGIWTQQGNKLLGTRATGNASLGQSVSISADGSTIIVGGNGDSNGVGAAWVFTRSAGIWTQQGNKLVGTGAIGNYIYQGTSVSISADGNTAISGGTGDNTNKGAVWVFTRSAGIWKQEGNKLIDQKSTGVEYLGYSLSISADGNTAIIGGWMYTRIAGTWTQQGTILINSGTFQSVFISADGNTAIVGNDLDSNLMGAAWVFTQDSTTGIENISNQNSLTLYPNPSNGLFTIEMKSENLTVNSSVEVYNVLGEKVYSKTFSQTQGNNNTQINLSNNPSGIYLYRVLIETGDLISSGKFIIQK